MRPSSCVVDEIQDIATKETRLGIPIIYGIDSIHGANYILDATIFPQNIAMGATGTDIAIEAANRIRKEWLAGDAFNVFVFLEISALSSYTLIALGTDRRALTASYQYLIMGTIGATFIIIGVGLMYMMTGTLNMADLAERLPAFRAGMKAVRAMTKVTPSTTAAMIAGYFTSL